MTTSIVLNTLTGAVSEHDLPFDGISAGYACSDAGLFAIGGDSDAGAAIDARAVLPITDFGSNHRKGLGDLYFNLQGPRGSRGSLIVQTMSVDDADVELVEEFTYPFALRSSNVSRAKPGLGIRANRLAVGYANLDGADFQLSDIEMDVPQSKTRRQV